MAVMSLVSEAMGTTTLEFFSSKILPVPSSTTRMDWEPKGTAMAAVESVISTAANIF